MAAPAPVSRRSRRSKAPPPLRRLALGARNALELARLGRLSAREGTAYEVVHQAEHYKLRHYAPAAGSRPSDPLLLVPPLMLTAEIYDVAPEISATHLLTHRGIDVYVVDFGAPEHEAGGMDRTLDDHVRAVADAVTRVREQTGRNVHLAGYSQGGMFCYQAAAYLKSSGLASLVTFGSPVDIHRSLPRVSTDLTARLIRAWRPILEPPLKWIDGLPGVLTSTAFKILSVKKELKQLAEFLTLLHDRRALEKREHRRRFLAGEGFVAWPGPALMKFIDEFVVHNRLLSGGFVIDGRTVTLADVRCPVLYFVGERDEIARPPSVRAVREAMPYAELHEARLRAGHFGLVVGSTAMRDSWPTVAEWIRWRDGSGHRPELIDEPSEPDDLTAEDIAFDADVDVELFYETALRTLESWGEWLNDTIDDVGDVGDQLRYQLPRLLRLRRLRDATRISSSRQLARRARRHGDDTFFLYNGRAVTVAAANQRVDYVVRGLVQCGVRPGQRVGVLMNPRPSYLTIVAALSRLGAVAILVKPGADLETLRTCLNVGEIRFLVADPENAARGRDAFSGSVLVLGGGAERTVIDGVTDMEAIDPMAVTLPSWYRPDPGRAGDVAMIVVTATANGVRAARITNRRWAFSAFGAAAACTLTPGDTVYCCLPLHHPAGLLVAVGGASVGGSRLALASRFEPDVFWEEVRRYGASVVFYAGEMCRTLVDAPITVGERNHPLRLFAGSGMRADVWRALSDRFGVGVVEFYAATEVSVVLANADGKKPGALGRPLPGSRECFVAEYDLARGDFVRGPDGRVLETNTDTVGVLLAKIDGAPISPTARGPVSERPGPSGPPRVLRDVLEQGDTWFVTGDLMRRDADGDHWLVDQLSGLIVTAQGPVASRAIEDALYTMDDVILCAAFGVREDSHQVPVAAVVTRGGRELDARAAHRALVSQPNVTVLPRFIRHVDRIPLTDGYRPIKDALDFEPFRRDERTWRYEPEKDAYVRD